LHKLPKRGDGYIFSSDYNPNSLFSKVRSRLYKKTGNHNLLRIHFHTFRHWRATREYEQTHDIRAVQKLTGHKSINNTTRYEHSTYSTEEYIVKRPTAPEEEDALISSGFQYVRYDEKKNVPIYRKRK
jgi:integrase